MLLNLQVLRAFAAFLVVLYHAIPDERFHVGRFGVDIFFVISGFIIVHTMRPDETGSSFFIKRVIRVVPLYWLLNLGIFSIALIMPALLKSTEADPVMLAKSLLFIPFMKANGQMHPLLFVGWTLNYEMFFYLLFALFVRFSDRRLTIAAVGSVLVALVAAGAVLDGGPVFRFYTDPIVLEFAVGMVLAQWSRALRCGPVTAIVVILAMLAAAALINRDVEIAWQRFPLALAAAAIVAAAIAAENTGARIANAGFQLVGAASYSLYLSHPYVIELLQRAPIAIPVPVLIAIEVVLCIAVACALYFAFEKPVGRFLRDRFFARSRTIAVGR